MIRAGMACFDAAVSPMVDSVALPGWDRPARYAVATALDPFRPGNSPHEHAVHAVGHLGKMRYRFGGIGSAHSPFLHSR